MTSYVSISFVHSLTSYAPLDFIAPRYRQSSVHHDELLAADFIALQRPKIVATMHINQSTMTAVPTTEGRARCKRAWSMLLFRIVIRKGKLVCRRSGRSER